MSNTTILYTENHLPKDIIFLIVNQVCHKTLFNFAFTCKEFLELCYEITVWDKLAQKELIYQPLVFTECWDFINNEVIIDDHNSNYSIDKNYFIQSSVKSVTSSRIISKLLDKINMADNDIRDSLYKLVTNSCAGLFSVLYLRMNWNKPCSASSTSRNHLNKSKFKHAEVFRSLCTKCRNARSRIDSMKTGVFNTIPFGVNQHRCLSTNLVIKFENKDVIIVGEHDENNNIIPCSDFYMNILGGQSRFKHHS
jgi:hypothetical protein